MRVPDNENNVYSNAKINFNPKLLKKKKKKVNNRKELLNSLLEFKKEFEDTFVDNQFKKIEVVEKKIMNNNQ